MNKNLTIDLDKEKTDEAAQKSFTMLIFGGNGDLAKRKLIPTMFRLYNEKMISPKLTVIGTSRTEISHENYRKIVEKSVDKHYEGDYSEKTIKSFASNFYYSSTDVRENKGFEELQSLIRNKSNPNSSNHNIIHYLAVPPTVVPDVINTLKQNKFCRGKFYSKVILEKPFGRDYKSAKELNNLVLEAFNEEQVYRIDHYLGKETVQNVTFFRFANSIFEPLWNRNYIDHIQFTVAERLGIGHRGEFYEQSGIVRDIIQNHMLQLIALIAMEPPVNYNADRIRDEKVKVFRTIRSMDERFIADNFIRGQYGPGKIDGEQVKGYRDEKDVAPDSDTATYVAGRLFIDNWRWADVPFYIRSGKRLKRKFTEIYIQFKHPPQKFSWKGAQGLTPNALIIGIQPEEHITLRLSVKSPGVESSPEIVNMDFNYQERSFPPYGRLLLDCIKGDLTLFARQDGIEEMWNVVDPIISYFENNTPKDFPNYKSGSWGPKKANIIMDNKGRYWR